MRRVAAQQKTKIQHKVGICIISTLLPHKKVNIGLYNNDVLFSLSTIAACSNYDMVKVRERSSLLKIIYG